MLRDSINRTRRRFQAVLLDGLAGRLKPSGERTPGYTILLPAPRDMPFLLQLALENLLSLDLSNCYDILIIPDGRAESPEILQDVARRIPDPRIRIVSLGPLQAAWADKLPRRDGGANSRHWITIMAGLAEVTTTHAFLHDIDSFLAVPDFIERQCDYATSHCYATLGVAQRWDPFFGQRGISLPATWELMFDVDWAVGHRPSDHKGGVRYVGSEAVNFDTMLWPQFRDYESRRIGLMPDVSETDYVHFNGTITSYRTYQSSKAPHIEDGLFRLLLLSIWESMSANRNVPRLLPDVTELGRGLRDPDARITYQGPLCRKGYAEFRHFVRLLGSCQPFGEAWCSKAESELTEFDAHYSYDPEAGYLPAIDSGDVRESGLQVSNR